MFLSGCSVLSRKYVLSWSRSRFASFQDWSLRLRKLLRGFLGIRMCVLFRIIRSAKSSAMRAESSVRGGYVAYVGVRITKARGAEEMVRAMGLLAEPLPIRLKLAGAIEPPALLQQLEARLDGRPLIILVLSVARAFRN